MIHFRIKEQVKMDGGKRYCVYACDGKRHWYRLWLLKWEVIDNDRPAMHMNMYDIPATHETIEAAVESMKKYCRYIRKATTVKQSESIVDIDIASEEFEGKLDAVKEYYK